MFSLLNIIIILFSIILLIFIVNFTKKTKSDELLKLIPGPTTLLLIQTKIGLFLSRKAHVILLGFHNTIVDLAKTYSDQGIFKITLGPVTRLFIFRKDLFEDLLKDNFNINKSGEYDFFRDLTGKGLAFNSGEPWRQRRKLLTPAFHFRIIDRYITVINEKANNLVVKLSDRVNDQAFDLCPLIFQTTIDVITETTLGYQMDAQQIDVYSKTIHRLEQMIALRFISPWLWPDWIFTRTNLGRQFKMEAKVVEKLTRSVINQRKQQFLDNRNLIEDKKKNNEKLSLLDLLLDKHFTDNSLTEDDIYDEVNTFVWAGFDTTAACLIWTLYLIGLYPDVQQKLFEEVDTIVSKDEDIIPEQIKKMKYLDAVIKESQRLYPPIHFVIRKITKQLKLGSYVVPEGVSVQLCIAILNMDPDVYPEPDVFDPDRFLFGSEAKRDNTFSFVPFSAGPRNCIGSVLALNELKIVLSRVVANFQLESLEKREDISIVFGATPKSLNGIKVKVCART